MSSCKLRSSGVLASNKLHPKEKKNENNDVHSGRTKYTSGTYLLTTKK